MQCDICKHPGISVDNFTLCPRCLKQVKITKEFLYRTRVPHRSKLQLTVGTGLRKVVQPVFEEVYFSWARNPDTDAIMPYDFYIPGLNLLVEAHGGEHYEFTPMFHEDRNAFIKRQVLDHLKVAFAEDNDVGFLAIDGRKPTTHYSVIHDLHDFCSTDSNLKRRISDFVQPRKAKVGRGKKRRVLS